MSKRRKIEKRIFLMDKYIMVRIRVPYKNLMNNSARNGRSPARVFSLVITALFFSLCFSHRLVIFNTCCPRKNQRQSEIMVPASDSQNTFERLHNPSAARNAAVMIMVSPKKKAPVKIAGIWYAESICMIGDPISIFFILTCANRYSNRFLSFFEANE